MSFQDWGCLGDSCQASFLCLISKITAIKLNSLWTFSCHSQVNPGFARDFPISTNHSVLAMPTLTCRLHYQCSTNKHVLVERGSRCWGPVSTLYRGFQGVFFGLAVAWAVDCILLRGWSTHLQLWSLLLFQLIQKESHFWFPEWEPKCDEYTPNLN